MPLPKPVLDNRTFDELVDEGRAELPRLAPAWTDHNASDPGITVMELLAWLTEMGLYRLDRVTDEQLRGFLHLVGVQLRPAQVARTVVLLSSAVEQALPAGLQLADSAGEYSFQSADALTVSSANLVHVVSAGGDDVSDVNAAGIAYLPFGEVPAAGDTLYLGFDAPLATAGEALSLWVWTLAHATDPALRARLIADAKEAMWVRDRACPPTHIDPAPWWQHYQARVAWEYQAASAVWRSFDGLRDETRALTLSGALGFTAPADHAPGGGPPGFHASMYWIRARLVRAGYECPPWLARIALNALVVEHAADVAPVVLPASLGHAQQRYTVSDVPVVAGSTRLDVTVGGNADPGWQEVAEFDLSGAHDRHYALDPELGQIRFGGGRRARVVASGAAQTLRLRVGGGSAGNVPAGTLVHWLDNAHNQARVANWSAMAPTLALEQPHSAQGGAARESLKDAIARAMAAQMQRTRAVTLEDLAVLAREVPGVPVARSRALAEHHPAFPCWHAAGNVTVVVVPDCPGPMPTASAGMREAVRRYLERRRPPATELHVVGARFVPVAVTVTLEAVAGASPEALTREARERITAYLDPLTGGVGGAGWPVGRDIYRSEILALLAGIDGVACVVDLGLTGEGDPGPRCENLPICDDALPVSGAHVIRVCGTPPLTIVDRSEPHECP